VVCRSRSAGARRGWPAALLIACVSVLATSASLHANVLCVSSRPVWRDRSPSSSGTNTLDSIDFTEILWTRGHETDQLTMIEVRV